MTQLMLTTKNWIRRLFISEIKTHLFVKGVFSYQVDKSSKSLFVEVIGCPGVGKSTLIYYMEKHELIVGLIRTKLWRARLQRNTKIDSIYKKILDYKQMSLEDESVKVKYFRHAIIPRFMDILVENKTIPSTIFLVDEGLFHHFKYEISDNWENDKVLFSALMEKRVLVHMIARPEIIAERILKRYRETGNLLPCYKNKQKWEIAKYCKEAQEKRKKVIREFEKRGVPVLTINAEDDEQTIIRNIDGFIKRIIYYN